jgi:hypothetical protein
VHCTSWWWWKMECMGGGWILFNAAPAMMNIYECDGNVFLYGYCLA